MIYRQTSFIPKVLSGAGSRFKLKDFSLLQSQHGSRIVTLADSFLLSSDSHSSFVELVSGLGPVIPVEINSDPTTQQADELVETVRQSAGVEAEEILIIGIGGGSVLDLAKACSVLLTNNCPAAELQGWDIPKKPGTKKIGIPTLSGTGAESSRTAVLINQATGLKLGINSDYSVFDGVVLDPDLTETVPTSLYFFNGMDSYMHSFEILEGNARNPVSDALARAAEGLCHKVFGSDNPKSVDMRTQLMTASFLAGTALTSGYVGMVHPISAALGVAYGLPHGLANVITLMGLEEFYPRQVMFVRESAEKLGISLPRLHSYQTNLDIPAIHDLALNHRLPLENHLGPNWKEILNLKKFESIVGSM